MSELEYSPSAWAIGVSDPKWIRRHSGYHREDVSTQAIVVHLQRWAQMMPLAARKQYLHIETMLSEAANRSGYRQVFLPPSELGVIKEVQSYQSHINAGHWLRMRQHNQSSARCTPGSGATGCPIKVSTKVRRMECALCGMNFSVDIVS